MKVIAPNFDSQSKTRLTNKEAKWAIFKCLTEQTDWQKFIKDCPDLINAIYKRCAERTHKQDKSQIDADANSLKKLKIAKLIEANSRDRQSCILFITEGDSAKGGLNNVRNPAIHAVMPLRGKILNVFAKKPAEALKSEIIKQLCAAIGLVPGKPADRSTLRYGKIYIMADADDDGQGSICPLVIELFDRYWPELFDLDEPFIHIFSTPLIIAENKKERKYFYSHNVSEFDPAKFKGWNIRRAKGLGSLQSENFKDALENPVSIPVNRDILVPHVMNLLFNGGRANDRKLMMEMTTDEVMTKIAESGSDWNSNALDI
jgi:DNA gyrase/topoisomerase IV subunit B